MRRTGLGSDSGRRSASFFVVFFYCLPPRLDTRLTTCPFHSLANSSPPLSSPLQVAVKFEKHGARCPQLRHEYKVYRELQLCKEVPKALLFASVGEHNVLVLELLGPSLEELFQQCGRRLSLRTTL